MNHERARDLLLDLAYGELGPAEGREVDRHVAECAECAAEWERIAATRRAMSRLGDDPRDDHRREPILEAARSGMAAPRPRRRPRWSTVWKIGATAAVAAIVAGVTVKLSEERPLDHVAELGRVEEPRRATNGAPAEDAASAEDVAPAERAATRPAPAVRREAPARAPGAPQAPIPQAPRPRSGGAPSAKASPGASAPAVEERAEATRAAADSRRDRAAAPEAAAGAALQARVSLHDGTGSRSVADAVEQLLASGALTESSREVTCEAVSMKQVSWADGEQIVKVSLRAPDGTRVDGWYDREGRLRVGHAVRGGPAPLAVRRHLDESGRVVHEEGRAGGADPLRWLPPRDPGAPGDGCEYRRE